MTKEKGTERRVLGRLIARELTEAELNDVTAGGSESARMMMSTSSTTTANGCPNGDYDAD